MLTISCHLQKWIVSYFWCWYSPLSLFDQKFFSSRLKMCLLKTRDWIPQVFRERCCSCDIFLINSGKALVENCWEFDGCNHIHRHRDYSLHCHDQDQRNQNHDERNEDLEHHEHHAHHLHEDCPNVQKQRKLWSKRRLKKTQSLMKLVMISTFVPGYNLWNFTEY